MCHSIDGFVSFQVFIPHLQFEVHLRRGNYHFGLRLVLLMVFLGSWDSLLLDYFAVEIAAGVGARFFL